MDIGLHIAKFNWPGRPDSIGPTLAACIAGLAALGVSHVQTQVPGVAEITPLEVFAERIIPAAAVL